MSENIITSDGLLSAPGTSNAFENEDKMEVSYDIANEDDLLGKSDDDEQIPPYQVPRKPKQPKQQRQSRDRRPQRSTSEPRTEQYRKRRRHSPSTENRKRSHSLSAEDKISQAKGAIKALKRHTDRGTCPENLQYRARAKISLSGRGLQERDKTNPQERGARNTQCDYTIPSTRNRPF